MIIRPTTDDDLPFLTAIAQAMGSDLARDDFPRCLALQREGARRLFLAIDSEGQAAGYVQLNFRPVYQPFRRLGIAEIQDLNVVPGHRRQGLGRRLVEVCEEALRQAGHDTAGISVGLLPSFGAAQRLYVAMGYLPDGAGLCYDDEPVRAGAMLPVDDLLTIKLLRDLNRT